MLHAKFQDQRTSGSGEEDLTRTIYINFRFSSPMRLHIKFGFDWPSDFRGEDV